MNGSLEILFARNYFPKTSINKQQVIMKYEVLFSASRVGGDTASKYASFFEDAKALGATWDGAFIFFSDYDDLCSAILKAAHLAGLRLLPTE